MILPLASHCAVKKIPTFRGNLMSPCSRKSDLFHILSYRNCDLLFLNKLTPFDSKLTVTKLSINTP